jgi:hypothetical protein
MVFPPEEGKAGNEVALSIGQAFSVDQILISETNMLYLRSFVSLSKTLRYIKLDQI